jgi:hypothetical protein
VVKLFKKGMDSAEDLVSRSVFAPKIPPAFDDSFVIAVYLKVSARAFKPGDHPDEEFKANGFGPADVSGSVERLPTWNEAPGSPSTLDGDCNAKARACIGEGMQDEQDEGGRDGSR